MMLLRKASLIGWGPRGYSGATCTLALCARGLLHTANIGDSRTGKVMIHSWCCRTCTVLGTMFLHWAFLHSVDSVLNFARFYNKVSHPSFIATRLRMILGTYSTGDEAIEHRILTREPCPDGDLIWGKLVGPKMPQVKVFGPAWTSTLLLLSNIHSLLTANLWYKLRMPTMKWNHSRND